MQRIQIASTPVVSQLLQPSPEVRRQVSALISYSVQTPSWTGSVSMFNWADNTFPSGFLSVVVKHLRNQKFQTSVLRAKAPPPLGPAIRECVVDAFGFSDEYKYQPYTVELLVKHRAIVAQIATGGGKSRVCKLAYKHIGRNTLFLTTRNALLHQMADSVKSDMGEEVGYIGDGEWSPIVGFNVGMVQTLAEAILDKSVSEEIAIYYHNRKNREMTKTKAFLLSINKREDMGPGARAKEVREFKANLIAKRLPDEDIEERINKKVETHKKRRLETLEFLQSVELVIMEEAHESSGDGYYDVMNSCVNAHYRMALTATPFMSEDDESNYRLMATSGEIAIHITEKQLIDAGTLATPYFRYIEPPRTMSMAARGQPYASAYKHLIVENVGRNLTIVKETLFAKRMGLSTLILIKNTAHGDILKSLFLKANADLNVNFIRGNSSKKERSEGLELLNNKGILIATSILDVGVDVPAVGFLILGGGQKAEKTMRQRIGRVLRKKKRGPNICFVLDFDDIHNGHLKRHSAQRKLVIENTDGFSNNLLAKGQDFPWERFLKAA